MPEKTSTLDDGGGGGVGGGGDGVRTRSPSTTAARAKRYIGADNVAGGGGFVSTGRPPPTKIKIINDVNNNTTRPVGCSLLELEVVPGVGVALPPPHPHHSPPPAEDVSSSSMLTDRNSTSTSSLHYHESSTTTGIPPVPRGGFVGGRVGSARPGSPVKNMGYIGVRAKGERLVGGGFSASMLPSSPNYPRLCSSRTVREPTSSFLPHG